MLSTIDKNLEKWLLLMFYVMLVVTMAIEVLRREIFSYSSVWGEEIVRYSFIYLVWIGAASAVRERAHLRIDVIFNYVPQNLKNYLYVLGDLVMLGMAILAVYWSWDTVAISWKFGSVTDGLRLSKVWFLMAVPLGFSLMIFRLLQSLHRDFKDIKANKPVFEGERLFD